MIFPEIHNFTDLSESIQKLGFLPLLDSGITGYSAEDMADEDCRYVTLEDGWDWPLWKWKGPIVREGNCVYGKFFMGKAGFISLEWWPDFMNVRRCHMPYPEEGSIEQMVLDTLREGGSMITRELRKACGFTGGKMRSTFDAYLRRLEMGCYIVTEDFIYPKKRDGKEYGWGWSLLTTPEQLYEAEYQSCPRTPEASFQRLYEHLSGVLPGATEKQILKLIG